MYKNSIFSSEVCKQLACELVTEQAEVVKHESLVKEIRGTLILGKQQLIKKLLMGKELFVDGKKRVVLNLEFDMCDDIMKVLITSGQNPDNIFMPCSLTKRESELVRNYKYYLQECQESSNEEFGPLAVETANELSCLKNQITLTRINYCDVDFSNATTSGFFEQSGLVVRKGDGNGFCMLEDLIC